MRSVVPAKQQAAGGACRWPAPGGAARRRGRSDPGQRVAPAHRVALGGQRGCRPRPAPRPATTTSRYRNPRMNSSCSRPPWRLLPTAAADRLWLSGQRSLGGRHAAGAGAQDDGRGGGRVRALVHRRRSDPVRRSQQPGHGRARARLRDRGDGVRGRAHLGWALQPGRHVRLPGHQADPDLRGGRLLGGPAGRRGAGCAGRSRHAARQRPQHQPGPDGAGAGRERRPADS